MSSKNILAVIPARGGSKRIPQKNIKEFLGKPIIYYSIRNAIRSNIFTKVVVSTDCDEIASLASKYGAEIPFRRSSQNSSDTATTQDVLKEVLHQFGLSGQFFDAVCCIYPTAALISHKKIESAWHAFETSKCRSLMTVVPYAHPVQRALRINAGILEHVYPQYKFTRTQDLETLYYDAGQFYFSKVQRDHNEFELVTKDCVPYVLDEMECQDIDSLSDWRMAEAKSACLNEFDPL